MRFELGKLHCRMIAGGSRQKRNSLCWCRDIQSTNASHVVVCEST
jgi:hypothetical protein